jgi:putative flippase GtrA
MSESRGSSLREGAIRWLKFNAVGGIGIVVQLPTLWLLKSGLHMNYLLATMLAVETAVLHNFWWHERFTWSDRVSISLRESSIRLLKFNFSNGAISIFGNLLLMQLFVGNLHVNFMLANVVAIAACSILNFLVSDRLVFESS